MTKEIKETKKKKSIFKRWWFWVAAFIIVVAAASSGGEDSTDTSTDSKITDEKSTSTDTDTSADTEEAAAEPAKEEAAPTVVWQNDTVTISYKELNSEGVKFLIENKSDRSITVQADNVSINGFSVGSSDLMMSEDIAPNSKGYATAYTTSLSDAGTPEKISGSLNIVNTETFDTIADAQFTDVAIK